MEAQFRLGLCLDQGEGISPNKAEAVKWYHKAVDQRHPEAHYYLGLCYESGKGVHKDEREASILLHEAARLGVAEAQYMLGLRYYNGINLRRGVVEGIRWILHAAEQKHEMARKTLAEIMELGGREAQNALDMFAWRGSDVARSIIQEYDDKLVLNQLD